MKYVKYAWKLMMEYASNVHERCPKYAINMQQNMQGQICHNMQ